MPACDGATCDADASQVVLRPCHWTIAPDALVAGLPGVAAGHQAPPVHAPTRDRESGAEAAALPSDEVEARVADIIRDTLRAHWGWFDPAKINHKRLGLQRDDERMYSRLNKLLLPGQLKLFVDRHPEFAWQKGYDGKGMIVTWDANGDAYSSAAA